MTWVAVGAAVIGGGTAIYSADKSAKAAKAGAKATQINPYNVSSPLGTTLFDPSTHALLASPADNPFMSIFNNLGLSSLANAGAANGAEFGGASPEIIQALQSANNSYAPNSSEAQDVLGQLRDIAAPQEQRENVSLDNQQFARGMLGTTGGAERFRALNEAHGQADRQRQLDATGIATQNANQRFSNALTTVNQGMTRQQNQFNMGTASSSNIQNLFSQLLNQAGIGIGAGGGQAPGAAVYAAQQAGNVPLAISQIATNPVWGQLGQAQKQPNLSQQISNLDWQSASPAGY